MPELELNAIKDLPDEAVLSDRQTARLLNLSYDTLRRIDLAGDGPPVVWLSERRKGRTLGAIRTWLAERTVKHGKSAA
jgi:hypothetical protein